MSESGEETSISDVIAYILRSGVILSSAAIVVGLSLLVLSPPPGMPAALGRMLSANFGAPSLSAYGLFSGLTNGHPASFLELGMLILLATPLTRVAASVLMFARERDKAFVGITALVLGMLLFAIFVIGPSVA